jgi:hypothetical protein
MFAARSIVPDCSRHPVATLFSGAADRHDGEVSMDALSDARHLFADAVPVEPIDHFAPALCRHGNYRLSISVRVNAAFEQPHLGRGNCVGVVGIRRYGLIWHPQHQIDRLVTERACLVQERSNLVQRGNFLRQWKAAYLLCKRAGAVEQRGLE